MKKPEGGAADLDTLIERVGHERPELAEQLLRHGALLIRGYDVRRPDDLDRFVRAFAPGQGLFNYAGGASPRRALGGLESTVYSSTEYPADMTLPLHNELSYTDAYPGRVYFCCLVAPQTGGETTVADSRRILARIDPAVVEAFRSRQVRYVRNLSPVKGSGYSWQEALETEDPRQAEEHCRRIGAEWEWREGGVLRISQVRPATAVHPVTGEEVWFNQADGFHPSALGAATYRAMLEQCGSEDHFRLNVTYGDGGPIEREALQHVRAVLREETVPHVWRKGDILVLDNLLAAHGRMPFEGSRKIAVAMN